METKLKNAARIFEMHYNTAKEATVGATIMCPVCTKRHTKTTYHKVFCSNQKTRKGGNCKDSYWNVVDEVRRVKLLVRLKQSIKDPDLIFIKDFLNL